MMSNFLFVANICTPLLLHTGMPCFLSQQSQKVTVFGVTPFLHNFYVLWLQYTPVKCSEVHTYFRSNRKVLPNMQGCSNQPNRPTSYQPDSLEDPHPPPPGSQGHSGKNFPRFFYNFFGNLKKNNKNTAQSQKHLPVT